MAKKCIICRDEAEFVVKGTSDYYCTHHAEECFGDVSVLQSIEEQAQELKEFIKTRMDQLEEEMAATGQDTAKD